MTAEKYTHYEKALKRLLEQKHYRQLRCVVPVEESASLNGSAEFLDFSSEDILGLSKHPYVKKNTMKFVTEWGVGSTPSRVIPSHLQAHSKLQDKLASLLGQESAMLFNPKFGSICVLLAALSGPKSLLFIDRLTHHKLGQSGTLSRGKVLRYGHNELAHLETLLERHAHLPATSKIIVSESIFSIEGDRADIKGLIRLANKYDCLLAIDDSHAMGAYGQRGLGLAAKRKGIDLVFGHFSRSTGPFGSYFACSATLREYLIHFSNGIDFGSPLPPAILGLIDAELDLIPDMEAERKKLEEKSRWLKNELQYLGWPCGNSSSHIIPIILGSSEETLSLSEYLTENGVLAMTLSPPSVPPGTSRIRLIINSLHQTNQLTMLIDTLRKFRKEPVCQVL